MPTTLASMDDRHARHRRRPADPRRRPIEGYRPTGALRFDRVVGDALRSLPAPLLEHLQNVEIHLTDLPPVSPSGAVDGVPLGRYDTPEVARWRRRAPDRSVDRLVLYRRPLEARARSRAELVALVREVVVHELAHHLGIDDDGIEELGWS
ncbi:MAG: metallopeptidase family protein [Nitriliruptor sp.]|nr:MAG: metallopeptidase family protein [Nitriliruptor sp.]